MKLIIDIPEDEYQNILCTGKASFCAVNAIEAGTPIPNNAINGKEILIKYCLEHNGKEIYDLLKRVFDTSMGWTDSRKFIIEWLEKARDKE